jgi:hypothetical protein
MCICSERVYVEHRATVDSIDNYVEKTGLCYLKAVSLIVLVFVSFGAHTQFAEVYQLNLCFHPIHSLWYSPHVQSVQSVMDAVSCETQCHCPYGSQDKCQCCSNQLPLAVWTGLLESPVAVISRSLRCGQAY